ncbi:MAG: SHOCT domain-containing protein [Muribaculaceae bacterium]|nr:SHOCT domain-containing protein [Muribaculaceae bacterium]
MDKIIQKINELSLRKWALIAIGLSLLATVGILTLKSFAAFRMNVVFGQLSTLVLLSSLSVYALKDVNKAKTLIIIAFASFLISMYGMYDAFNDNEWIVNWKYAHYEEILDHYINTIPAFLMIQNLIIAVGFFIGVSNVKKQYKTLWWIFTCVFVLSFLNVFLYSTEVSSDTDYARLNIIISVLQLISLIILFVIGGKANSNDTESVQDDVKNDTPPNISIASKSEALFGLKELLDANILTQQEFEDEKAKVLAGKSVSMQKMNELKEMKKLLDAGIINQSDFEAQKSLTLSTAVNVPTAIVESSTEDSTESDKKWSDSQTWLYVGAITIVVVLLIFLFSSDKDEPSYHSSYDYNTPVEQTAEPAQCEEVGPEDDYPTSDYYYGY